MSAQDTKQGDGEPLPAADPFAAELNPRGTQSGGKDKAKSGQTGPAAKR